MGIREDIAAGLKQAIERGFGLEEAKRSFINAGYNIEDVNAAIFSLSGQISSPKIPPSNLNEPVLPQTSSQTPRPSPQTPLPKTQYPPIPKIPQLSSEKKSSTNQNNPKKRVSKSLIIVLVIVLLFLLIILGALFIFKDKIIDFFG